MAPTGKDSVLSVKYQTTLSWEKLCQLISISPLNVYCRLPSPFISVFTERASLLNLKPNYRKVKQKIYLHSYS